MARFRLSGFDLASIDRALVKTVTYRLLIVVLDFCAVYLLTGRLELAAGFMVVSNIYTSIAYYAHERAWERYDRRQAAEKRLNRNRLTAAGSNLQEDGGRRSA